MGLSFTVGGARGTFEGPFANEVAGVLDNAFAEGDWEGVPPTTGTSRDRLGRSSARVLEVLGDDGATNLIALGVEGRGVYLPPKSRPHRSRSRPAPLRCAVSGLRHELAELASAGSYHWTTKDSKRSPSSATPMTAGLPTPRVLTFARLALAANEAVRRDCPLWLVG